VKSFRPDGKDSGFLALDFVNEQKTQRGVIPKFVPGKIKRNPPRHTRSFNNIEGVDVDSSTVR